MIAIKVKTPLSGDWHFCHLESELPTTPGGYFHFRTGDGRFSVLSSIDFTVEDEGPAWHVSVQVWLPDGTPARPTYEDMAWIRRVFEMEAADEDTDAKGPARHLYQRATVRVSPEGVH
ncbi:MAG: hypothetical protein AAGN66_07035 [Acidobacteriota bacterium]